MAPEDQTAGSPEPPRKPGARRKLWFFATVASLVGATAAGAWKATSAPLSADIRSGSPGFRQSSSGQNQHWKKKALTIYLDDSIAKLGATEAVTQAFGHWVESDPLLPDITFDTGKTSATPKQDGKSTISFGRITAPGHEKDLAITVTYSDNKTGEIVEADVIMNSLYAVGVLKAREDKWRRNRHHEGHGQSDDRDRGGTLSMSDESEDCQNRYDVQNVATHEAGHFFGLGEDPVELDATMFQTIDQCETHKRVLSTTDVSAVGTLYKAVEDPEEAAAGPRACSFVGMPQGPISVGWVSVSGLVLGLLVARRRLRG